MRITSTTGASIVQHDGAEYTADDDGIFEVPQHIGEELIEFPGWLPEHEAKAIADAEQAERDSDGVRQAERIAALEAAVADLGERLAALEGDDEDNSEGAGPKTRRTRGKAKADDAPPAS